MSLEEKRELARKLLVEFYTSINEKNPEEKVDKFFDALKKIGGVSEEALALCKWEDIEECGVPRLIAKRIADIFRAKKEEKKSGYTKEQVEAMSLEELVSAYDHREPENLVGERLAKLSKNQSVVVFVDGKVDVKATLQEVQDIRDGLPPREYVEVGGEPRRTYCVGDSPEKYGKINPLYPDQPLRSNETCSVTNQSWSGVTQETRQLIYLAVVETREIRPLSIRDALTLIRDAHKSDAKEFFSCCAPRARDRFNNRKENGDLPSLRMKLGGTTGSTGKNNPFLAQR